MKPKQVYGRVFTGGQVYHLLNPQPLSRDSCWNDGTYMFLVANPRGEATTIVTNNFTIEYMSAPEKMLVEGMLDKETPDLELGEPLNPNVDPLMFEEDQTDPDDFAVTFDLPGFESLDEPEDLAELIDQGNWEDAGVPPDSAFLDDGWEGEDDYE